MKILRAYFGGAYVYTTDESGKAEMPLSAYEAYLEALECV